MKKFSFILIFVIAFMLLGCKKTQSLQLNEADTEITLTIGEERTITPLVDSGTELDWKSSNNNIASVTNGTITGVGEGKAIIYVSIVGSKISEKINVFVTYPSPISVEIYGSRDIFLGESLTLNANVYPENAKQNVVWSSSDEKIASVDEKGTVTALSIGEVIITARVKDTEIFASTTINIKEKIPEKITILGSSNITIGSKEKYIAMINPSDANSNVIWEIDNDNIASINEEGVLQARDEGIVTITCISKSNEKIRANFKVNIAYEKLESLAINGLDIVEITQKPTYTVTASPKNACKDVYWSTDNEQICNISKNGVLTPISEGTCTIYATSKKNNNIIGMKKITIYQKPTEISCSIPDFFVYQGFAKLEPKLFSNDHLIKPNIIYSSSDNEIIEIDETGKVVAKKIGRAIITICSYFDQSIKITKEIEVLAENKISKNKIIVTNQYDNNESFIYDNITYIKGINAFTNINKAIEKVNNNGIIYLTPNEYIDEIDINKSITLTGNKAVITNKINIYSSNVTIDNLEFTSKGSICGSSSDSINNFTFINNYVHDLNEMLAFMAFPVLNENNFNQNFYIAKNNFNSLKQTITSFIRFGNIKDIQIKDNTFQGKWFDAIIFFGNGPCGQETNISGIGASGDIEINNNNFTGEKRAITFALYSANNIIINDNTFSSAIQFQKYSGTKTHITINFNTFENIKEKVGIKLYNNQNANIFGTINYNKFISFLNSNYKYIDNQLGIIFDGNYNYFSDLENNNIDGIICDLYFNSEEELEKAIAGLRIS